MNVALCRGEHKAGHEADGAVAQGTGGAVIMSGCHEEGDTEHRQTQYRDMLPHCETSPSPEGPECGLCWYAASFGISIKRPLKQ